MDIILYSLELIVFLSSLPSVGAKITAEVKLNAAGIFFLLTSTNKKGGNSLFCRK